MFGSSNLGQFFRGGTKERELRETEAAWDDTQALWRRSPLERGISELATELTIDLRGRVVRAPALPVQVAIAQALDRLLVAEDVGPIEPVWRAIEYDIEAAMEFRQMLVRRRRWATNFDRLYSTFQSAAFTSLTEFIEELPEGCFGDWESGRADTFDVTLVDLLDDPASAIQRLFMLPYDDDAFRYEVFARLRERSATNLLIASGFSGDDDPRRHEGKLVLPTAHKSKNGSELAELYLRGSPLKALLDIAVPFHIPAQARFEHCHIVGGTGHGKTQLMQKMIHADLVASQSDGRSVIVIDSQGDLINKLTRLELFAPDAPDSLADRLVVIDPADVEFPAALNLFDAHLARVQGYLAADRERILNGVVELYELFFGAFLGAELTQKQGVVFRYLARLMLAIPNATIHTLMKIMEDGKAFKPFMDQLDGSARYFFETEFFHPSFAATKKQILRRLWGVLSTPAFERMFTQERNKLDLFEAMNEGKIILVSTAKDLLKREGSQLLGRFFIAMISQAALERSTLPERQRNPTFVYVDEAQEYFDDSVETILTQARKYHVGLTLAHQTLDQLSPRLRSSILTNTSMKCVGGTSSKDARALADELHTTSDFIEGMRRRGERSEFAVWVKHLTGQAIRLSVPLGFLERQPTLADEDYDALVGANRAHYCGTLADIPTLKVEPQVAAQESSTAKREPSAQPVRDARAEMPDPKLDVEPHTPTPESSPTNFLSNGEFSNRQAPSHPSLEPTPTPVPSAKPMHAEDYEFGKGGQKHRYLQKLVKDLAEQQGLLARIEAPLAVGEGQVDVLLERDGVVAAIEISVSTPVEHEATNVRKCLASGYPLVGVVLVKSKAGTASYRAALLDSLSEEERQRVTLLSPEEIPDLIASLAPLPEPTESVVKGYRVRTSYNATSPEEAKARREALARIIARSIGEQKS